jgi:hypothetical protein
MHQATIETVTHAFQLAKAGVDYHTKNGAFCPWCGVKLQVRITKPWIGKQRVRYQRCGNPECLMNRTDQSIKSIQVVNE